MVSGDRRNVVVQDLAFPEAPRWRDGALWWSDMHAGQVCRLTESGIVVVCDVPERPSGLGWLPDGRLLVVSMMDRRVLRRERDGQLVIHADLAGILPRRANDMVVDRAGRAYVGNFGFDLDVEDPVVPTVLVRVDPDGAFQVVADGLVFPNGMVITDGGRTLVVAETYAARLTAFDIHADGSLSGRRVWAQLDASIYPDGICLDAAGAIWIACPSTGRCMRIREGGGIEASIAIGRGAFACALGGQDGRTLFVCTADSHDHERQARERNGRIEAFDVSTPGADAL